MWHTVCTLCDTRAARPTWPRIVFSQLLLLLPIHLLSKLIQWEFFWLWFYSREKVSRAHLSAHLPSDFRFIKTVVPLFGRSEHSSWPGFFFGWFEDASRSASRILFVLARWNTVVFTVSSEERLLLDLWQFAVIAIGSRHGIRYGGQLKVNGIKWLPSTVLLPPMARDAGRVN